MEDKNSILLLEDLNINFDFLDFKFPEFDENPDDNNLIFNDVVIESSEVDTNYRPSEEKIINEIICELEEKVTPLLISLIKNEDFEFGQKSESIRLVEKQLKRNKIATQNWFNSLYLTYFVEDENILIGLLRIVEFLNEDLFYPTGQTMALASLSHRNIEVKELGVRIFENWCSVESYNILKSLKVDTKWLQDYINQVVVDFELELELCAY